MQTPQTPPAPLEKADLNPALLEEVKGLLIKAVNLHHLNPQEITANTSLRQGGLELDSVDILEIVVTIEHHFGIKVADAEVGKKYFRTLGTIVEFVQDTRAKGA